MSFKKILFSVCILLSNTLYQQEIQPRLDLSAQQAWEYFGNKSTIKPQIIKVQGSQYYNEEFELSDLKYFGRKMESIGYMRYDAYNDVIEMADTPDIERSEILLLKNLDVIATINEQEYVFLLYDDRCNEKFKYFYCCNWRNYIRSCNLFNFYRVVFVICWSYCWNYCFFIWRKQWLVVKL